MWKLVSIHLISALLWSSGAVAGWWSDEFCEVDLRLATFSNVNGYKRVEKVWVLETKLYPFTGRENCLQKALAYAEKYPEFLYRKHLEQELDFFSPEERQSIAEEIDQYKSNFRKPLFVYFEWKKRTNYHHLQVSNMYRYGQVNKNTDSYAVDALAGGRACYYADGSSWPSRRIQEI